MTAVLSPGSVPEFVDAIRGSPQVTIVGAGTKPRLAADHGTRVSTTALCGIVEYDPSEFTITALAGTPVRAVAAALAERGQYLPFDPLLVDAGATLGGTVASGVSGPGRFRYGGLRDFILGTQFIDGSGRLLRVGGKVVKNAAGFDLPKFFVGSLGRFGALVECTFKVFPRAPALRTLTMPVANDDELAHRLMEIGRGRWEIDALDATMTEPRILLRLAAATAAADVLCTELIREWPSLHPLSENDASVAWSAVREFRWADPHGVLMKIVATPGRLPAVLSALREFRDARLHVSGGGNAVFLSLPDATNVTFIDEQLRALQISALTLRGNAPLFPGARNRFAIEAGVKKALDPVNRFPSLDD